MSFEEAKEKAVRYLVIARKTEYEVRNKLKKSNCEEEIIDKVDNDKVLNRHQRNRLITFLEKSIYHCKGMISTLDGTYHKE